MKLWIDDLRTPPGDDWLWAKTSEEALSILRTEYSALVGLASIKTDELTAVSFDHDLGGDDTSRPVMLWMAEYGFWPPAVYVHTMNVVGAQYLMGIAARYAPPETYIRRVYL
jgi:hypothetical protein